METIYKVVYLKKNGTFVSSFAEGVWEVAYEIGVEAKANNPTTMLFAFSSLDWAYRHIRYRDWKRVRILECRTKECLEPVALPGSRSEWLPYWERGMVYGAKDNPPPGTVWCKSLTPIRVVEFTER